jgi:hypothetical protein
MTAFSWNGLVMPETSAFWTVFDVREIGHFKTSPQHTRFACHNKALHKLFSEGSGSEAYTECADSHAVNHCSFVGNFI